MDGHGEGDRRRGALADLLNRLGLGIPPCGPSVWVHGPDRGHFEAVLPSLGELAGALPRYHHVLTSGDATTRRWLRDRCPAATILPPPFDVWPAIRTVFRYFDPRALVLLGSAEGFGPRTGAYLRSRGRPPFVVPVTPGRHRGAPDLTALLVPLLRAGLPPVPWDRTGRIWHALAGRRMERIEDLTTLFERLGRPRAILCLGNGPSSRSAELAGLSFDALFRVNWRWIGEDSMPPPRMVFTADGSRLPRGGSCILGIRTREEEAHLARACLRRPWSWRLTYASLARLPLVLNERDWAARPTNGAAMVATAAALQPARLIVAGIDLFEHPAGAYPGDSRTPNAYLAMHDRDVEVAILRGALAAFRGELIVLGAPLRARLGRLAGPAP